MHSDPVTAKLMATSDSSEWQRVGRLDLDFGTDHPQGPHPRRRPLVPLDGAHPGGRAREP